jgi:N4-gp56 family major capsid protein
MAISNFQPELWAGPILANLREQAVYVARCNRQYEGMIRAAGDTVHITSFTDPAVRDYVKNTDISWDLLADATQALVIDQADYFAFTVDDVDRRQSLPGFVDEATTGAGSNLALEADEYVAGLMYAATNQTAQDLGLVAVDVSDNNAFGSLFVAMRTKLQRNKVPGSERWIVIPPEVSAAVMQDPRFVDASASGSSATLREGFIGRIVGFDVYESNVTHSATAGTYHVIAGHPMATTFADQIADTEAVRLQDQFGDGIRGLHLYGGKVVRPTALALASVTVAA